MTVLFHFTCRDGAERIEECGGVLRPGADGLIWLTDLEEADVLGLGLTSHLLKCDRTEFRYVVDTTGFEDKVHPYGRIRMSYFDEAARDSLELTPQALPRHWFVATCELPAIQDPKGGRQR